MPRLKKERYEKIIDDYLSGMTQREVGEVNGVGRDAVGNILRNSPPGIKPQNKFKFYM